MYTIGGHGGNGGAQDDAWCTPLDLMVVMEELKMTLGVHHCSVFWPIIFTSDPLPSLPGRVKEGFVVLCEVVCL